MKVYLDEGGDKRLVGSLNETHLYAQLVRDAGIKQQPVERIMQPAFPFVDISTPEAASTWCATPSSPSRRNSIRVSSCECIGRRSSISTG